MIAKFWVGVLILLPLYVKIGSVFVIHLDTRSFSIEQAKKYFPQTLFKHPIYESKLTEVISGLTEVPDMRMGSDFLLFYCIVISILLFGIRPWLDKYLTFPLVTMVLLAMFNQYNYVSAYVIYQTVLFLGGVLLFYQLGIVTGKR